MVVRGYPGTHPLTHSRTHALTHSRTHALTHSRTHALTHSRLYAARRLILSPTISDRRHERLQFEFVAMSQRSRTNASVAMEPSRTNPAANEPVCCLNWPSIVGSMNPPSPPTAPTTPVAMPICRRKHCGTSWNTAPLPRPRQTIAVTRIATIGAIAG